MMKHLFRTRRSGFTQFLFFVLTIVLLLAGIAQADWNSPTFFSTAKQYDLLTQSAGDLVEGPDGTLHAVWTDYDRTLDWPATAAIIAIRYSRSTDGGASWSPATTITSTSFIYSYYGNPRITVSDAGRIHITYYYLNYYGYSTVNYAKSNDRGQTWEITGLQNGCFPWYPSSTLDRDGNVYAAWELWKCNYSNLPYMVYFSRSLDQGNTWESPMSIAEGGVMPGWILSSDASNNLHLIFESPGNYYSPGGGQPYYARSQDRGATWQITSTPVGPTGFVATGIFSSPSTLLIPGQLNGADVFIRSTDGGSNWSDARLITGLPTPPPGYNVPINQIAVDGQGKYHTWKDQSFVTSSDGGQTWSDPDYMGNGSFGKLVISRTGKIFALAGFACPNPSDSCAGIVEYREPFGVDAPAFQSYWEKASFRYSFKVRGTGTVKVSFPKDAVALTTGTVVTVGNQTVPAMITVEGDRAIASFPVEGTDWISCSLPIIVTKGSMGKWAAIKQQLVQLNADFRAAAEAGNADTAVQTDAKRRDLQAKLLSSEREFVVSLLLNGVEKASDRTAVLIYEQLTSVSVHLKADPSKKTGVELLLKTADSIAVDVSQPFLLEVKVTHLKAGKKASVTLAGNYSTNDVIVTNAVGTHKSDCYLFYSPSYPGKSDEILINVTVDGVTTTVPIHVTLN
jgi:hypothetical protein